MLSKINKIISILLTIIFIAGIFPPVIFAEPNQVSLGEVKGFNRAVIDSHFSKADRETNPDRWLAEAKIGITQAICAWELIAGNLYDNPLLYEEAKAQIEKWSDEELEKRFSLWLMGRFFGKAAEEALINLSSRFSESQKNYSWHLDKDGNVIFDDKTGDPLVIRPNEEGREFSVDLKSWRSDTDNIVNNTSVSFDNSMLRLYPELLAYIPVESRESMSEIISKSLIVQRNVIKHEFENIAAREERIFTNRRTRDIWSLRKKSDDEAAKIFTEKLIAETDEACKRGIEEINTKIEQASAGTGDLAILGEEWLRLYKEQFERGLKAWEEAEERFFIRRIEWEQDSFRLFGEGEDIWLSAFNQFEEGRQKWELSAKELFQAGETLFINISEDFEKTVADAKKEFELNMAIRIGEGTNKVKALIDIYLINTSTAMSFMENVKFWQKQYGNSEKDIKDEDFANWISNEIKKYSTNNLKYKALIEIQNSYNAYLSYLEKSLDARNRIYENYAELFGTGALKDILSPNVSDDFYLDEYQIALLRAKALVLYWERKTSIADAVMAYAGELSAGRITEAEGTRTWEKAKAAYNESLAIYETELNKLNTIGEDVQRQQEILHNLTVQLQIEEDKLNKLYSELTSLSSMSAVSLGSYYSDDFNKKYINLLEKYEELTKTGDDAAYFSALVYGMLWDISEQRETAELIKNTLKNNNNLPEEEKTFLYNKLNSLNPDFQSELQQNTCDSLSLLFQDYGLKIENNFFPDIQSLCQVIFTKSENFAENTALFLSNFDKCFTIVPEWLQYEIDNWKEAVIEYITTFALSQNIQPKKSLTELTEQINSLIEENSDFFQYLNRYDYYEEDKNEQINNKIIEITNNFIRLNYLYKISESWEQMNLVISTVNEKHWRQYLKKEYITNEELYFLGVSSKEESILADALFYATYYTNRINDSFNIYSKKDIYYSDINSNQLYLMYNEKINNIRFDFNLLNSQYNEIINAVNIYESSILPPEKINEQLSVLNEAINAQNKAVNPLRNQYTKEAEIFFDIGSQYDNQYKIFRTAHDNTDQKRFEYEKQDAIQRWASTSYINTDNIDPDNCRANLEKAQTVLEVLSDISNNDNRITYNNPEYEMLYIAYEQSFLKKLKALEAIEALSSAYTQETIYNEDIYRQYQNYLFQLGISFNYDNYNLPESRSKWKIENMITVNNGRLAFSRDNSMSIFELSPEETDNLINFFKETEPVDGERFNISAYEKAIRDLNQRMSVYFNNPNKFTQWSYARNYLIYSLINANNDLSFLKNNFSPQGELNGKGSLADVIIKPDHLKANKSLLAYMEQNFFAIDAINLFQLAWDSLNSEEKADLEFYVILTLTNNNSDYFAGFKEIYAFQAYAYAANEVYSFYKEAQDVLDTWYRIIEWPSWRESKDVNLNALYRIVSPLNASASLISKWRVGLQNNLSSINNLSSLYNASCEKLDKLEGKKTDGQKITWADLEITLSLSKINVDDIAILKTCWETMQKNNNKTAYQTVFEALTDLYYWTDKQVYSAKNNLETRFSADMQNQQLNEDVFLSIVDNYFNGTADINKVKTAAKNAYGKKVISSKYFLDNIYDTLINNLSLYMDTDFNFYSLFSEKGNEIISLTENSIYNKYNAELKVRETEWAITRKDIAEKFTEWQKTAALILENGRTDWNESSKKLQDAYKQWNTNFQSEYERVNNEWAYAYLAGLEDKEKWLEQAANAVNQASSEAFLSLVGAEGERLSRFMDTREPFGIMGAIPEAQTLMANLLQSSGIVNMSNAFNSLNNYTGITSPLIKRGIGGSYSWDSAIVKAAASNLAKKTNEDIAKNESKKLAYNVRLSKDEMVKELTDNVNTANKNFREQIDNIFIFNGLWRKSGNNYVKDIIKGSTLFTPVITQTVNITGYRDYIMESIKIKTNLDDDYLANLNSIAIQELINNVYTEVKIIADDIFGKDQKPIPITKNGVNREQSPGKFGKHIGYNPATKQINGMPKNKEELFYDQGAGELGRLMSDFQYWQVVDQIGNAELTIAPWDKRIWDDGGSWFKAPSIRTVGIIAGTVLSVAVTAEAGGTGGVLASIILTSASEVVCSSLDAALGYKTLDEAAVSAAKTVLTNTVTSVIGNAFNGVKLVKNSILAKTLMTGTQTFTSGVATNLISGITYTSANGFGYSVDNFNAGMKGTFNSLLTSMASTFTSTGLTAINSGLEYTKLEGFNKLNKSDLQNLNGLIGSLAGQGVNYALGNDFTLNVLNLSALTNDKYNSGLLELHLGRNGVNMNLGTGGANVSVDYLASAYDGAKVWNVNTKISKYGEKNNFDALIALRTQYGYGDYRQKDQLWDILKGNVLLNTEAEGRNIAETIINEDGKRVINLTGYKKGMSKEDQYLLGVVLGYEAYRDGYTIGQTDANGNLVTYTAQSEEFKTAQIAKLAMSDRIQEENKWFYEKFEGLAAESTLLGIAQLTNNMSLFNDYMELVYDNSKDYLCISTLNGEDYQSKYDKILLFNSVLEGSAKETEINAQRLQEAFERYNAKENPNGNNDAYKALYNAFILDKNLQKEYGYKSISTTTIADVGCMFMSTKYAIEAITGNTVKTDELHKYIKDKKLFAGDNLLTNELMAKIMTSYTNNEYNVTYMKDFGGTPTIETLKKLESPDDKYVIHLRIKNPTNPNEGTHSVMVTSIDYTYDEKGNINGIDKIIVANSLQESKHINTKTSYSPSDIFRWDIFKVTENKK